MEVARTGCPMPALPFKDPNPSMKKRSLLFLTRSSFPSIVAVCLAAGSPAHGALFWDGGSSNIAGDGNGASAGGSGTWNATLQNWDAGVSPHVAWSSGNEAVFGGSAGPSSCR